MILDLLTVRQVQECRQVTIVPCEKVDAMGTAAITTQLMNEFAQFLQTEFPGVGFRSQDYQIITERVGGHLYSNDTKVTIFWLPTTREAYFPEVDEVATVNGAARHGALPKIDWEFVNPKTLANGLNTEYRCGEGPRVADEFVLCGWDDMKHRWIYCKYPENAGGLDPNNVVRGYHSPINRVKYELKPDFFKVEPIKTLPRATMFDEEFAIDYNRMKTLIETKSVTPPRRYTDALVAQMQAYSVTDMRASLGMTKAFLGEEEKPAYPEEWGVC